MELFKSGLKTVLGHSEPSPELSGAETVERLVERLRSSTLLEDRRDACRGLKAMSKKFRVEVGAQAMNDLVEVLVNDSSDIEIASYALDALCNITCREPFDEEEDIAHPEIGDQFTEIFIKSPENVNLAVSMLAEYDFKIRFPSVKLITNLLTNRPRELQDLILVAPMAVSKMMDLLNDPREVIRNDALIMLTQLTKGNANIQKIVAFEGAFDRLYDVIVDEGTAEGGIVVEDCLLLMLNLLKNNASNQSFFREGSYIQKLTPFFRLASEEPEVGWSAQKVSNVHYMLQVVRTLVSPSNPKQDTSAAQRVMHACGLLTLLCEVLMASGVPADILTETINAVSEVIRGSDVNQQFFAQVMAPSEPPRPAIVVLLMSMVNEKQPFVLRCAVLYCFQCYLFKNHHGQSAVVQTLLPSQTVEASGITAGQLLCGGLFSSDPLSNWFSAVALSHALVGNSEQRAQLLRVQLATSVGNPPVSLLQQSVTILQQTSRLQTRIGLLMLLGTWLAHCPAAVTQLLRIPSAVPYLMSQLNSNESDDLEQLCQGVCAFIMGLCAIGTDNSVTNYTKDDLVMLIERRVGVETFLNKLGLVMKHEFYSRSLKHPQLSAREPRQLVFEHEFCKLFKNLEGSVIKVVTLDDDEGDTQSPSPETENDSEMVQRYKQLIRTQDEELARLRSSLSVLEAQSEARALQIDELTSSVEQLKDQNTLLRAQISTDPDRPAPVIDTTASPSGQKMSALSEEHSQQMAALSADWERRCEELSAENVRLQQLMETQHQEWQQYFVQQQEQQQQQAAPDSSDSTEVNALRHQVTDLQQQLATLRLSGGVNGLAEVTPTSGSQTSIDSTQLSEAIKRAAEAELEASTLRQRVSELEAQLSTAPSAAELSQLRQRVAEFETSSAPSIFPASTASVTTQATSEVAPAAAATSEASEELRKLHDKLSAQEKELRELRGAGEELEELRREQEDLLVLLTDQEARQEEYKKKLRQLGVEVEDDDD
ncbi:general vesicular transport factor p115-like [Amphibalanus amphitrite]|uniref:general vesicular transport factor p115-like n=1 Tax=Amphibalanus amphitrite TaxID=1232801 RepID=UPI001C90B698|nr:general vesicular transport factor p115-like [Amphibalanus amphitrite]XP_043199708.1 general vesicular transport factor p115-like [Amphibalanus amphitrite]